jgi:hypothetical protein
VVYELSHRALGVGRTQNRERKIIPVPFRVKTNPFIGSITTILLLRLNNRIRYYDPEALQSDDSRRS